MRHNKNSSESNDEKSEAILRATRRSVNKYLGERRGIVVEGGDRLAKIYDLVMLKRGNESKLTDGATGFQ